jgi:hypothetical protein
MLCVSLVSWDKFQTRAGREDVVSAVEDIPKYVNGLDMAGVLVWRCGTRFQNVRHSFDVFCVLLSSLPKFIIGKHVEEHECLALWGGF